MNYIGTVFLNTADAKFEIIAQNGGKIDLRANDGWICTITIKEYNRHIERGGYKLIKGSNPVINSLLSILD